MDMNVGSIKPPEMPFEPNVGKASSSQPAVKAQLPEKTQEVSTLSPEQKKAIGDLKPKFESNIAIIGAPVDLSEKVAGAIDSILKK